MVKVKVYVREGYGTEQDPFIGSPDSRGREILTDIKLGENEHITHVSEYDFPAINGEQRVSEEMEPLVRISRMNNLNGKVLTLVDATFTDPEQRKAFKDILGSTIWNWYWGIVER